MTVAQSQRWVGAHLPLLLAWTFTLASASAYSLQAILRHDSLGSNALDLGYEDQVLWNTLHGHPFAFSLLSGGGFSLDYQAPLDHAPQTLLGYHAELLLAPLSLLYAVLPDVRALLALQAVVVCAGALAAFGLARRRLHSAWAGCFVAIAYLCSPFVEAELLSDFHTVALDSAIVMLLFYLLERRWFRPALVAGLLAAAAKEDAPVILAFAGLWTLLIRRWRSAGIALLSIGLGFALFDFLWLLPHFSSRQASPFLARYGYLGQTPLDMLVNTLRHPAILAPTLGSAESRNYFLDLLGSSGGLPLLSPLTMLIAAPSVAINVLATFPWMRSGMAHYSALVLPVLIASAVEGIRVLAMLSERLCANGRPFRWHAGPPASAIAAPVTPAALAGPQLLVTPPGASPPPQADGGGRASTHMGVRPPADLPRRFASNNYAALVLAGWLALAAAITHYQIGAGPGTRAFTLPLPDAHARMLPRFLAQIPADAAVSASSGLAPHLSERQHLYLFPNVLDAQDILVDLTATPYPLNWTEQRQQLLTLLQSGTFGVADAADGYVLLRRGAPLRNLPLTTFSFADGPASNAGQRPLATFAGHLFLLNATTQASAVIGAGWQETLTLDWTLDQPLASDETLAIWTNGTPRPLPPDFTGETPTLIWRATSNWQPGQVIRVVVPALAVPNPRRLQVAWFHPQSPGTGLDWLPCVDAAGRTCPLGNHFVVSSLLTPSGRPSLNPWLAALDFLRQDPTER